MGEKDDEEGEGRVKGEEGREATTKLTPGDEVLTERNREMRR